MNCKKLMLPLALFLIFLNITISYSCTTAIVSGEFTKDGRPLLFKHRDTGTLQNKIMFFEDGKYKYIGVVNSTDTNADAIWQGVNSAGFAIMNSASYNLNLNDTTKIKDREGIVMKMALQRCATLEDFEKMLTDLPKPLGVEANFGVIDANGGAAYYETAQFDFKKYDVNDRALAPFGYIIRTNYSYTRDADQGYGYIRYETAHDLFSMAAATGNLSAEFILQDVSRSLKHSLTGTDLTKNLPTNKTPMFVHLNDYIVRHSSATTTVVQGVKPGEPAELATMWTVLGFQLCSVAVPVWVNGGEALPDILKADESGNAPLCDWALELKKFCFPVSRGSGKNYINLAAVMNQENTGILQKLKPLEDKIISKANSQIKLWRNSKMKTSSVHDFYQWLDETIPRFYQEKLGIQN